MRTLLSGISDDTKRLMEALVNSCIEQGEDLKKVRSSLMPFAVALLSKRHGRRKVAKIIGLSIGTVDYHWPGTPHRTYGRIYK